MSRKFNSFFKEEIMLVKCLNCGKDFDKRQSQVKKTKGNFCSRSCAATFNNAKTPKRKKGQNFCKHCGLEIYGRRTCCDNCNPHSVDWSKRTLKDLRELRKYQPNSRIRDLSRDIYINSGAPKCCQICGYDKVFHVCHIKPVSSFSLDTTVSEINVMSNLIALCPNHHWELDHGLLDLASVERLELSSSKLR